MARQTNRLTAAAVQKLNKAGRFADGAGLYLIVDTSPTEDGARKGKRQGKRWLCYFQWRGKRREMGLGPAVGPEAVSLPDAREAARGAREAARKGRDPISERRHAVEREASIPTFGTVASELIESLKPGWRSGKTADLWTRSLERHARQLKDRAIDTVVTEDVLAVLKPLWTTKPETANKLRQRIEAVLDAGKVKGWRTGENPARWRGHLAHLLPKLPKLSRGHRPAMPFEQLPAFMVRLSESKGVSARALEWTILTASREGMTLNARWGEIDEADKLWTIPAARMKTGKDHRVPLPAAALAVLDKVRPPKVDANAFVFPGARARPLSNMAMDMLMRDLAQGFVPHGFRSTFRDWAGERTNFPREIAEEALAHAVGSDVERAYRRGDALEKRRKLMDAWGAYATSPPPAKKGSNVVDFQARG
jgi:integrase